MSVLQPPGCSGTTVDKHRKEYDLTHSDGAVVIFCTLVLHSFLVLHNNLRLLKAHSFLTKMNHHDTRSIIDIKWSEEAGIGSTRKCLYRGDGIHFTIDDGEDEDRVISYR